MPMSARLLRPRASGTAVHPEAVDWATRVTANGGTVSSTTLAAVSKFCAAIDAAGIRDRFLRLNLFCGNSDASLNAVRTPLYRGQSLAGTQYGASTDSIVNFVASDYNETGSAGGLKGNGTTKSVTTGLQHSTLNSFFPSVHLSNYTTQAPAVYSGYFLYQGAGNPNYTLSGKFDNVMYHSTSGALFGTNVLTDLPSALGHRIITRTASNAQALYRNGALISSDTTAPSAPVAYAALRVFATAIQSNPADQHIDLRAGAYSFGLGVNASQAAAYNTAIKAFQTALGRP